MPFANPTTLSRPRKNHMKLIVLLFALASPSAAVQITVQNSDPSDRCMVSQSGGSTATSFHKELYVEYFGYFVPPNLRYCNVDLFDVISTDQAGEQGFLYVRYRSDFESLRGEFSVDGYLPRQGCNTYICEFTFPYLLGVPIQYHIYGLAMRGKTGHVDGTYGNLRIQAYTVRPVDNRRYANIIDISDDPIPEPATFGLAAVVLGAFAWRRKANSRP